MNATIIHHLKSLFVFSSQIQSNWALELCSAEKGGHCKTCVHTSKLAFLMAKDLHVCWLSSLWSFQKLSRTNNGRGKSYQLTEKYIPVMVSFPTFPSQSTLYSARTKLLTLSWDIGIYKLVWGFQKMFKESNLLTFYNWVSVPWFYE